MLFLGIKSHLLCVIIDYLSAFRYYQFIVYQCFNSKNDSDRYFSTFIPAFVRARENSCCQNGVNLTIVSDEVVGQENISI